MSGTQTLRLCVGFGHEVVAVALVEVQTVRVSGDVVALGIDVGERQLDIVGLDDDGEVALARVVTPEDVDDVIRDLSRDVWVAIDAPDEQRTPKHLDEEELPRKFHSARCAEIALGRLGYWVP